MAKRKNLSKKTRFEVFKRDDFQCQYCGASAPDVVLQVDHIEPVSRGGDNDMMNLITSCHSCNSGKSDRELDDDAAITKQRAQLEELNQRREQLEMMLSWRESMKDIGDQQVEAAVVEFEAACRNTITVNDHGRKDIKKLIKAHGLQKTLDAIETATDNYLKFDDDGRCDNDTAARAIKKLGGIIRVSGEPEEVRKLYYIRGIVRNRMYCNEWRCIQILKEAQQAGAHVDDLADLAKEARNWTCWQEDMEELIQSLGVS